ncbi:MAG: Sec63 [Claussenomyces sp. TS43310]|nr:MAG: Sec63 [Claussenomyces sp. TS43310]
MDSRTQKILDDASSSAYMHAFSRSTSSPELDDNIFSGRNPPRKREQGYTLDNFDHGLIQSNDGCQLAGERRGRTRVSLKIPSSINDEGPDMLKLQFDDLRQSNRHQTCQDSHPQTQEVIKGYHEYQRASPRTRYHSYGANQFGAMQTNMQQLTPPRNLYERASIFTPPMQTPTTSSPPQHVVSSPSYRLTLRRSQTRDGQSSRPQATKSSRADKSPLNSTEGSYLGRDTGLSSNAMFPASALPMVQGVQLVPTYNIPDRFRQLFPFQLFNAVQSQCFESVYNTNDNVVVSAPTGSGKTAILELAIYKLVEGSDMGQFKVVYQAPTKSLCAERARDWQKKFSSLNLQCAELTGDTSSSEVRKVGKANIIITTPEKWDSITRKWKDYDKLLHMVKLFLIDEVHILKDIRGATLEAVVSRMKSIGASVRFVALSATLPNSLDIATWLGKDHANGHSPARLETFDESFRPVRLQKHVYGFESKANDFAFDATLDQKLPGLISKHTHKKPIMVFCFTRKSCEKTAGVLSGWWAGQPATDHAWLSPTERITVISKDLQELVKRGVAFHHAGLDPQDRTAVEVGFLRGQISVIVCTSTLAVGVNLPCHLVVIKGTVGYSAGKLTEYSDLEVMQMLGRAGRPQFDDSAIAIIMTRGSSVDRYKKMVSGQEVLESTLHLNLIEHLNSEIGLGTIHDVTSAKRWLGGTFLSVRMRQNPSHYVFKGLKATQDTDETLEYVCDRDIRLLQNAKLITDESHFRCTEYGEAMSRYMIQFETMKLLLGVPERASIGEIATELKDLRMKPQERSSFRDFNKSPFIKYPIKETIASCAHKISLIIQVQLGGVELPMDKDFNVIRRQYLSEQSIVFDRVHRLVRCVIDCKVYDGDAISIRNALEFARSISAGYWENGVLQLRQLPMIGLAANRRFVQADITSIQHVADMATSDIERVLSRNPPFGKKILDHAKAFPSLTLSAEIVGKVFRPGQQPKVQIRARLGYANAAVPFWRQRNLSLVFLTDVSDGTLAHFWRGTIKTLEKQLDLSFVAELAGPDDFITCHVACEEVVGTAKSVKVRPEIPPSAFPSHSTKPVVRFASATTKKNSEFDEDDLDENDLLAAVNDVEGNDRTLPEHDTCDDFADVDEFEDEMFDETPIEDDSPLYEVAQEPTRMINGKWECNHICKNEGLTKSGKPCSHRCCREGLDKPRRPAKPRSPEADGSRISTNKVCKKPNKKAPEKSGLKYSVRAGKQRDDVEVVDLADELPALGYSDLTPRPYRNLHDLHSKIQDDKPGRILKSTPTFSYGNGIHPDLSFLEQTRSNHNRSVVELDETLAYQAELPSIAELVEGKDPFRTGQGEVSPEDLEPSSASSHHSNSRSGLEMGTLGVRAKSAKEDSSFADTIFDFEKFGDDKEDCAEGPSTDNQMKRGLSCTLDEEPTSKRCRIGREIGLSPANPSEEPSASHLDVEVGDVRPAWLAEIDKELLDFLGDAVTYI